MDDIKAFRKEFSLTLPLLIGKNDKTKSIPGETYGVIGYPTTLILDADGKVVTQIVGGDLPAMEAAIKKLGIE